MRAATRRAATTSTTHDPSDRSDTHALHRDRRPTLTRSTAKRDTKQDQNAHTNTRKRSMAQARHNTRLTYSQPNPKARTRPTRPPTKPTLLNTRTRNNKSRNREQGVMYVLTVTPERTSYVTSRHVSSLPAANCTGCGAPRAFPPLHAHSADHAHTPHYLITRHPYLARAPPGSLSSPSRGLSKASQTHHMLSSMRRSFSKRRTERGLVIMSLTLSSVGIDLS